MRLLGPSRLLTLITNCPYVTTHKAKVTAGLMNMSTLDKSIIITQNMATIHDIF